MAPDNTYYFPAVDSGSDLSGMDDSVRSGTAILEIMKDLDNPRPHHSRCFDEDGRMERTGTVWTASAHVITAVIGSGVLSLAWSMAQLGWIAGPVVLMAFAFVTYYTSILLTDTYRYPGPVHGKRNYTYMDAVRAHLGGSQIMICGIVQYANLVGTAIGYTITASISMVAIKRSDCFHEEGEHAPCHVSNNLYMCLFGIIQIILSQIPDFHEIWWLSIVAAVMSFAYSGIGLGLAIGKTSEKHNSYGSATGMGMEFSEPKKFWSMFQALGNIAFAYAFSMILIEIQDTVKSPPAENKTMRKASLIGIATTTLFYMSVGCLGYAAFGDAAPGNLLTGFGFYNPFWLVDFANACIVIHLVGAYQVYCQPLFAFVEGWVARKYSGTHFLLVEHTIELPYGKPFKLCIFRVVWRSLFVMATTMTAMILPFFNDIMGLLGAAAFWPLTVYFPISMHISQAQLKRWTVKWFTLQTINITCLIISLGAALGSIIGIIHDLKKYTPFKTGY